MDSIWEAIQRIKVRDWKWMGLLPVVEQYVATGAPHLLAQLTADPAANYAWTALAECLETPARWTDHDRRLVQALARVDALDALGRWFDAQLASESESADITSPLLSHLGVGGLSEAAQARFVLENATRLEHATGPNSAGRWLLARPTGSLLEAMERHSLWGADHLVEFARLVVHVASARLPELVDAFLQRGPHTAVSGDVMQALLSVPGVDYRSQVLSAFAAEPSTWGKFEQARALLAHDPVGFREQAFEACRATLLFPDSPHHLGAIGQYMVERFGGDALPVLVEFFEGGGTHPTWSKQLLGTAVSLGQEAVPVLLAALQTEADVRRLALAHLIPLAPAELEERLIAEIARGLAEPTLDSIASFAELAGRFHPQRHAALLWPLLEHKSRAAREAAARALGRIGDAAVPAAGEWLRHRTTEIRLCSVILLQTAGTQAAEQLLGSRLEHESNERVLRAIHLALEQLRAERGALPTESEVAALATRSPAAAREAPAWIGERELPRLHWAGGRELSAQELRYLLHRQSLCDDMEQEAEARAMYRLLSRAHSEDFALALLQRFVRGGASARNKWALVVAASLGGDGVAQELLTHIHSWAEGARARLAEHAVDALSMMDSELAITALLALSTERDPKADEVGRAAARGFEAAAARAGLGFDALTIRAAPRAASGSQSQAKAGHALSEPVPRARKSAPRSSAPRHEVPAAARALTQRLSQVVESALSRQLRWSPAEYQRYFLENHNLLTIAERLVWAAYDARGARTVSFRPAAEGGLLAADRSRVALADTGSVGLLHPLELDDAERIIWNEQLAADGVEPPFPQLARLVERVRPEHEETRLLRELWGRQSNALSTQERAGPLGWSQGSLVEGDIITSYVKRFPAAGVDAILSLDGHCLGVGAEVEVVFTHLCFVPHGSVAFRDYQFDEPQRDDDPRLVPLGEVPRVAYSEALLGARALCSRAIGEP